MTKARTQFKSWNVPQEITIMTPQRAVRARGIYATTLMKKYHLYMGAADHQRMKEEANALGISDQAYLRWCILCITRTLRQLRTGETFVPDL